MKSVNIILRLLCQLIDTIVWMFPVQFLVIGVLQVPVSQAVFLYTILMAVYETVSITYFDGYTLGKFIGKLHVIDKDGCKPAIFYVGIRSLTKSLYYTPFIGQVLLLVSIVMYYVKGTTLHDVTGKTTTVIDRKYKEIFNDRADG